MWPKPRLQTVERALTLALAPSADPLSDAAKRAAVAVVLRETDVDLEVLLIQRAIREGDPWSGHIALPGGHLDQTDENLLAAAIRETLEEVGVDLRTSGRVLGRLRDLRPVSGLSLDVSPFCFALERQVEVTCGSEVVGAFWVPLGPLALGQHDTSYGLQRGGVSLSFPAWEVAGKVVWGMTYRLLSELLDLIRRARSHPA